MQNKFLFQFLGGGASIIWLTLLLCVPVLSKAQTNFITAHTLSQAQLSPPEMARFTQLQGSDMVKSIEIISISDVANAQQDGILKFLMPGTTDTLIAEATQITHDAKHGLVWSGTFLNKEMGSMSITHRNGRTFGFINKSDGYYDIAPAGTGKQFLIHRKPQGGSCGQPTLSPPPDITVGDPNPPACDGFLTGDSDCAATITVLLMATPEATAYVSDTLGLLLEEFGQLCEAQMNLVFQNSNIPNKSIRVKIIEKSGFTFAGNYNTLADLEELYYWSINERAQYRADIVFLVDDQYYFNPIIGGGIFGAASLPNDVSEFEPYYGFGIFAAAAFSDKAALPHEFGHIFGCRHNWTVNWGNDDTPICAHGRTDLKYGLGSPNPQLPSAFLRQTVVTVGQPDFFFYSDGVDTFGVASTVFLNYSNPDVTVGDFVTGSAVAPVANNARQIRGAACLVANYNSSEELGAYPSASPLTCVFNIPVTFNANITAPGSGIPGVGPYTVNWYWNKTGIFDATNSNGTWMGAGATITIPGHKACPGYWVKCVISSSDGITINRVFRVYLGGIKCECKLTPGGGDDRTQSTASIGFHYTNPIIAGTALDVPENSAAFSLSTANGTVIHAANIDQTATIQTQADWPSGMYILHVRLNNGTTDTYKLFIIQSK